MKLIEFEEDPEKRNKIFQIYLCYLTPASAICMAYGINNYMNKDFIESAIHVSTGICLELLIIGSMLKKNKNQQKNQRDY